MGKSGFSTSDILLFDEYIFTGGDFSDDVL
jgi:hypothetical protein